MKLNYAQACAVLGVSYYADYDTIKKAYRAMCKQYHPDENKEPDAVLHYEQVQEAYQTIQVCIEQMKQQMYYTAPVQNGVVKRQAKVFGSSQSAQKREADKQYNEQMQKKLAQEEMRRKQMKELEKRIWMEKKQEAEQARMQADRAASIIRDIIQEERREKYAAEQAKKAFAQRQRKIEEAQERWNHW